MPSFDDPYSHLNTGELYNSIVEDMLEYYQHEITPETARDAANNLIAFCRIMLEISSDEG